MTITTLETRLNIVTPTSNVKDISVNKTTKSIKERIQEIALNSVKKQKLKSNKIKSSYNYRFLRFNTRVLYYKTIKQQYRQYVENIEEMYSSYLQTNMLKIEKREKNKKLLTGMYTAVVPMAYRLYSYTKVYITHCVKNTFVTIFKGQKGEILNQFNMAVLNKFSCGLIGYKGPKKSTVFARKEVIKEAGNYLGGQLTTLLTVIFTSKVSRWNRKSVRNLCPNLSYVLTIFINYKRAHGYQKQKNKRRT